MATFTVTIGTDPGTSSDGTTGAVGTLSWALAQANATDGPHTIDITVDPYTTAAVMCCDGRRVYDVASGAVVTIRRGELPVRVVRLSPQPFTDRLVAKFGLPVNGWRGQQ